MTLLYHNVLISQEKALHLYVHFLHPGVDGNLMGQWLLVCLNSFQLHGGNSTVCSPESWVGTGTERLQYQGNSDVKHLPHSCRWALYKNLTTSSSIIIIEPSLCTALSYCVQLYGTACHHGNCLYLYRPLQQMSHCTGNPPAVVVAVYVSTLYTEMLVPHVTLEHPAVSSPSETKIIHPALSGPIVNPFIVLVDYPRVRQLPHALSPLHVFRRCLVVILLSYFLMLCTPNRVLEWIDLRPI